MTARLRHDFDAALHEPLSFPILFEGFERPIAKNVANALDRFDDIGQPGNERTRSHQNTRMADASMCGRRILCRLSQVMMSAFRPRIAAV